MSWAYWLSVRPKTYLCPQTKTLLFYSSLSGVGVIGSLQITYQVSLKIHQYPCIFLGEKMHFESKSHSCFLLEITNKIAPNVWLKPIPLNLKSYTLTFWLLQLQPNRPAPSKSFFEEIWEKSVMITRHLISWQWLDRKFFQWFHIFGSNQRIFVVSLALFSHELCGNRLWIVFGKSSTEKKCGKLKSVV